MGVFIREDSEDRSQNLMPKLVFNLLSHSLQKAATKTVKPQRPPTKIVYDIPLWIFFLVIRFLPKARISLYHLLLDHLQRLGTCGRGRSEASRKQAASAARSGRTTLNKVSGPYTYITTRGLQVKKYINRTYFGPLARVIARSGITRSLSP